MFLIYLFSMIPSLYTGDIFVCVYLTLPTSITTVSILNVLNITSSQILELLFHQCKLDTDAIDQNLLTSIPADVRSAVDLVVAHKRHTLNRKLFGLTQSKKDYPIVFPSALNGSIKLKSSSYCRTNSTQELIASYCPVSSTHDVNPCNPSNPTPRHSSTTPCALQPSHRLPFPCSLRPHRKNRLHRSSRPGSSKSPAYNSLPDLSLLSPPLFVFLPNHQIMPP